MNDIDRIYFNQGLLYHKDNSYNSGGLLDISICSSTTDYKNFSAPTLHISITGSNNLRKIYSLNYSNTVDLFCSLKEIYEQINQIYSTGRSNELVKKYSFDKILKFEFILLQNSNERVVSIYIIHSDSDFSKVIIPYSIFLSFYIGILKYFVNEYVSISFNFSNRNLLTELLEQNKLMRNSLLVLPTTILDSYKDNIVEVKQEKGSSNLIETTLNDLDKFLGKDMQNINLDVDIKKIEEEKPKNIEVKSLLINNTLTKNLNVLDTILISASTRPDSLLSIIEGFRRSMNLDKTFSFLPGINDQDFKSFLYISKLTHDLHLNLYLSKNVPIPSSFPILKFKPDEKLINDINIQLCYDLLLIFAYVKIFRERLESKEEDGNINGSLFYLRLRTFLDPLIYSFIDENRLSSFFNKICDNFDYYNQMGFFNEYQTLLNDYNLKVIDKNDVKQFCNDLESKIISKNILKINIKEKHDDMYKFNKIRLNSNNNLNIEQIINEFIPLEISEKTGTNILEQKETLQNNISKDVFDIFFNNNDNLNTKVKKEQKNNLLKTVEFFNNEIPINLKDDFIKYVKDIGSEQFDYNKFNLEEFGDNIIKSIYRWNETENKEEPYTEFRLKLENCLLTKDLILAKYRNEKENINENKDQEWDLGLLD